MRILRVVTCVAVIALASSACTTAAHRGGHRRSPTTTNPAATSTTTPGSGTRTVLAPVGLNLRAQPSASAPVVRTAAEGAVLTVLGHTGQGGGWFQVRGATVTGWITDDPTLSAPGSFTSYSSAQLQVSLLYPQGWSATEAGTTSVVFRPPSGGDSVVLTTAGSSDQLGHGRPGYQVTNRQQVVVCGVTTSLVTYRQSAAPTTSTTGSAGVVSDQYLAQVRVTLDPQHALGLDANVADPSQLDSFRAVVYSVTFPFPQCQGAASP